MANLSDVYDIKFTASNKKILIQLFKYLRIIEKLNSFGDYNTTDGAELIDDYIDGFGATGRWVYSNNLDGTFANPNIWFGGELEVNKQYEKLKNTMTVDDWIEVNYSEDEPGCGVYQTVIARIILDDSDKMSIDYNITDKDPPDCDMVFWAETNNWYCETHGVDENVKKRYCHASEAIKLGLV